MKKFLFTLAALLMAGSAFAAEVTTIDHEFTADEIGKVFLLPINLTVDNEYINGWDFTMTYPEGLTVGTVKVNSVLTQMVPSNADGDLAVVSPMGEAKPEHIVGAYGTAGYWDENDDGVFESYGAVKLGPDGTIKMYEIRITPTAEFTGGDVTIEWMVSGGFDLRNGQDGSLKVNGTAVAHLTVAAAPQPVVAPEPTFDWSAESFTMEAVCEGHDVVLMIDGQEVDNPYTVEQTYEEQKITFTAYTKANANEDENSATVTSDEVTIPAKQKTASNKPTITVTPGDDVYTIEATGTGTVELYINGEKVEGTTYTVARPAYGEDPITVEVKATNLDSDPAGEIQYEVAEDSKTVTVPAKDPKYYQTKTPTVAVTEGADAYTLTATCEDEGQVVLVVQYIDDETGALTKVEYENGTVTINRTDKNQYINYWAVATANIPDGYDGVYPASSQTVYDYEIPAKEVVEDPTLAGQIVFSDVNQENGQFTVKYVGDEAGVTITLDDETIELVRDVENKYQLPDYGTYNVTATAAAAGYKSIDKDATLVWTKTEPAEKPGVPKVLTETTDETVTVSATAEGAADKDVTIYLWDPEANNGEGDFVRDDEGNPVAINNPSSYTRTEEDQTFYVKVVATNEAGETWSDPIPVNIPKKTPTGVDELVNGKTVAGVRYFNMAGQEMQEANGVTIVVTTYTDGTTSAVKVIK